MLIQPDNPKTSTNSRVVTTRPHFTSPSKLKLFFMSGSSLLLLLSALPELIPSKTCSPQAWVYFTIINFFELDKNLLGQIDHRRPIPSPFHSKPNLHGKTGTCFAIVHHLSILISSFYLDPYFEATTGIHQTTVSPVTPAFVFAPSKQFGAAVTPFHRALFGLQGRLHT